MTQHRDWQKDMEMCKAQEGEQWCNNGKRLEEYDRLTEEGCRPIAEFEREEEAEFVAECREALPYWLQEAKVYKQSYEAVLALLNKEQVDHSITKDKEQQLKVLLEKIDDETRDEWIGDMIKGRLSTLYPDTPAPKEAEHE